MKIAVWHNLPSGGGKRALYDHVRGLVARGHAVEAWCPPTADRDYLPLSALIPEHVVDLAWPVDRLIDRLGITLAMERQVAAMDAHCQTCAEEIHRGGFDILFANACMFFRTTSIGRFAKIPSVLYLGEPYRWLYEALPRLRWLAPPRSTGSFFRPSTFKTAVVDSRNIRNWRLQAREEVDNAAAFSRILVNSYFSRESVLRAYGLDADVCYPGIDVNRFIDKDIRRSGDILVGVGSITPEKNVRLCVEAIATISLPRPKLVWIGNVASESYLAEIQDLAKSRGVAFEVNVGITDSRLVEILNQATAMLYAPRLEPFGLAPLEANACGLPVVAVAEGGVRETIIDQVNGLVVDNTSFSMGAAISRLLTNPTLARQLGVNARVTVQQKWNMGAAIDRLERLLVRYTKADNI
jgi:glycosyltransferase involved in cell wall biosynthesis